MSARATLAVREAQDTARLRGFSRRVLLEARILRGSIRDLDGDILYAQALNARYRSIRKSRKMKSVPYR